MRTMRKSGLGSNALERSGDMNNLEIPVGTSDFAEIRQMSDISRFLCVLYVFHKNSQKIQKNTCKFVHVVI